LREIESQLKQLETKEQELQRQVFEASTSRKNEMLTLKKNIALYEVQLERNSRIVSEYSGRVLEIAVNVGQVLSAGSRIASVEVLKAGGELVCVTYFPVRDGKKVRPGMKIQITPDTVKRERFGGILGAVLSVSAFPVTKEAAALFLGTPEVANQFLKDEPQIEVVAELAKDTSNVSGFKWSSSKGPALLISAGTTTTARVTVEERAPVSYILPFLRSVSGIY
jgi:HlyD family secretion protein